MISNFFNVIFKPNQFMETQSFRQAAWFPLLLVAAGLILLRVVLLPELRKEYSGDEFKKWYVERQQVTEEEAEKEIARMDRMAPYISMIEAPVMVIIGAAGIALFLSMIGRLSYKQKIPFIDIFHMTAWASSVSIFPILVQVVMKSYGLGDGLPSGVAFYLPKSAEGTYYYNFLQTIDLFLIWQVWLLGLGVAALYGVHKQRALSSVGTLFIVLAIFNAMALTITSGK